VQAAAPAAPAAPVAASAPAPAQAPSLAQQLHGPIVSLRSAADGEHVVVVRVSPEHLGPVTVHATVSNGDLAVQLFAASPDSRDALQTMLTDLRRDLGSGGVGTATTLSLGTGDAPQQDPRGQSTGPWQGDARGSAAPEARPTGTAVPRVDAPAADRRLPTRSDALLDVLA
jgi:flagellar hook-length control protein FliK